MTVSEHMWHQDQLHKRRPHALVNLIESTEVIWMYYVHIPWDHIRFSDSVEGLTILKHGYTYGYNLWEHIYTNKNQQQENTWGNVWRKRGTRLHEFSPNVITQDTLSPPAKDGNMYKILSVESSSLLKVFTRVGSVVTLVWCKPTEQDEPLHKIWFLCRYWWRHACTHVHAHTHTYTYTSALEEV